MVTEVVKPILVELEGVPDTLVFWCPGCECAHYLNTIKWSFNGDFVKPTATPSLLVRVRSAGSRCHFFIRDGQLQFLADSTHPLAGKTVPMVIM